MSAQPALQRFVDDELLRAPMLADQLVEETLLAIKRESAGGSLRERQLTADVLRALNDHRQLVVREFVRALREQTQRELAQAAPSRPALPTGPGGLSLVDEAQVEVDVEISRAIEAVSSVAEHELREVMSFTSALVGDMDVARDYNPLRPEVMGQALWQAAQALPLARAFQLAFMRHASQPLAQLMRKAYAGACARLEAMGVEPATYRTVIIFGSQRGRRQQDSFFDPQANRAESTTPLPGPGGRPQMRDAAASATAQPGAAAAARAVATAPMAASGSAAAAATATPPATPAPALAAAERQTLEQVLARADRLLRELATDADAREREGLRRQQRQQLVDSAAKVGDRETIELVGELFDTLLGDRRLAPDLQNLLARLQSSALRLALRDRGLLNHPTHPLWLLVDRIALQGELHPQPPDPERTQMLRQVHGLLDTLISEQPRDADPFRWARERLLAYERSRFEQRRGAADAELHSLQALEDQVVAGGPPPTSPGALDIGQLDTVPADLLDDLSLAGPGADHPADGARWLAGLRSGDWVHMFMQGGWVNAQLLWYGRHREYWLFADGASASTWAIRRGALERMLDVQLLTTLAPRSLIREAAERVLRRDDERGG